MTSATVSGGTHSVGATNVLPGPQSVSPMDTPNISNVGSILDVVFSGESVRSPPIKMLDAVPLGATISVKLKNKIWANEFVDLRSLLPDQSEEPLSITIKAGKIDVEHTSKNKSPLSINQWTDAFLIFSTIYIQKNPQEAGNLLKYCFSVREMSHIYIDSAWRGYDESFRRLRESHTLPWENSVPELRLKVASMGFKVSGKPANQTYGKQNPFRPFSGKVCFAFNRGQQCASNPCKYAHLCQECTGKHPKSKCFQREKQHFKGGNRQKQSANAYTPNKPAK
ncbi:uncharacterized protein LOC130054061 [Ostrea edulis]|uniref:uncharacterized protein LOC130054061 n=1 Tax=Ostrea edulis TaxID=37623 RepID=UPI0024AF3164|nr:uncharacterized protein LOC130054061 [Ostrea edulis]